MAYLYVKSSPKPPALKKKLSQKQRRLLASLLFIGGIGLFLSVLFPILHFQLGYSPQFNQLLNPLSSQFYNPAAAVDNSPDLTNLSNWFISTSDSSPNKTVNNPSFSYASYSLSIPKLKIDSAEVVLGSEDLKKSLIQYPKTAMPGQFGSPVIFGHSVLPQFFNPKSYVTIFSTLHKLKQGDEIIVDYDRVRYKYLVSEMYEVQPTDLSVLEQRFDGRYLTLITCSPPGTYLRRLVVKAQIADNP